MILSSFLLKTTEKREQDMPTSRDPSRKMKVMKIIHKEQPKFKGDMRSLD